MKSFPRREKAGKRAAKAFSLNIKSLLGADIVVIHDMQDDKVEGCDFDAVKVHWIRSNLDAETKALMAEIGQPIEGKCLKPKLVHGGIEVKCMQPNESLHRDDMPDIKCICLQLGEWNGTEKGKDSRKEHGWVRRIFQPRWKPKSAKPIILEFILECWDGHGGIRPYASISFTDFDKFRSRIIEYGKANGLALTNWKSVPVGEKAKNFECGNLIFKGNVWYVPLNILVDIAQIVLIGAPPDFYKNGRCTKELQKERYQYLCEHAVAHVSDEEFRRDGEIMPSTPDHLIFDLLRLDAVKEPSKK